MRTVGQALVEGLRARGVEVVFGIPGVHTIELYRGLAGGGIRHVTPRHEQGAAFMADGYARASGKPGVAFVITGPGLLNALTAMGQAKADSVPILVISGVNRRASLGRGLGLLHELPDQAAMVRPLCPTERLEDPAQLEPLLDRAFAHLLTGRPGPVHIEVPTDVMPLACPAAPRAPLPARPAPDATQIAEAARLLNEARRPVILAGGGARGCDAGLRQLAERLDAPVILTVNARGMLHGHPLGLPASPSLDAPRELIRQSDRILALGTELGPTDYDMYVRGGFPDLSEMIRVDVCAEQLARHPAALTLQAETAATIAALLPHLAQKQSDGPARAATAREKARAELAALHPSMPAQLAMVEAIRAALPGAQIVGDSTQPVYAANLYYDHDRPGGWFNAATGFGALGFGPGAAIGAAIAHPGTPTICLIGDGGLQFDPAELRVAVDEGLPVTFVVWNNSSYREIAEAMRDAQTEIIGCTPSPLNLAPFAAACDLPFQSVAEDPAALRAALATPQTGPRLIEIRVTS
ncbi:5-guanidino-2-oxopentanoate decarboxylase [Paragemmobacter ruber]|uniref:5-guanidino-2-oxopentanoate decarboxylase n=1 Tax=Paragemmobacter ruber TaxID=1985673 RepID=A0ABW9Y7J0_9RHOB|nr:5-guanidino-2-oxopentanoate decarboxylase [Rhodobacter ruber]NBE07837.1 5-guanidino-2-oxopentanoate decarboxylase [Rhodobacter ruber]